MMRHYSLIDGAMVYDALNASPLFTDPTVPWYIGLLPGKKRRLAGPLLIDMDLLTTQDNAIKLAVNEIFNGFPGRLHVSQLQSEQDLAGLAHHLQRFTCFYNEKSILLGFRFADTRILIHLPTILTQQQWSEMSAPIQQWTCYDRRGKEVILPLPEDRAHVTSENQPFALSSQQAEKFNNATEPDRLLNMLNDTPEMKGKCLDDYWYLAQQCVQTWQKSGSEDRELLRRFAINIINSDGQALEEQDWVMRLSRATPENSFQCLTKKDQSENK